MAYIHRKTITRREIELAIVRIQKQRPRRLTDPQCRLSITSVAKEAGLTPAAIHNCYPDIAEQIRALAGKASRAQRDEKHDELLEIRKRNRNIKSKLEELTQQLVKVTSINASLTLENSELKQRLSEIESRLDNPKVVPLRIPR